MTESARRLEAAHGRGLPHLWPHAGMWACTLGSLSSVARDPCVALKVLREALRARDARPRGARE